MPSAWGSIRRRLTGRHAPRPDSAALEVVAGLTQDLRTTTAAGVAEVETLWESFDAQPTPPGAVELHAWLQRELSRASRSPDARVRRPVPEDPDTRAALAEALGWRVALRGAAVDSDDPSVVRYHRSAAALMREVDALRDASRERCDAISRAASERFRQLAADDDSWSTGRRRAADALDAFRLANADADKTLRGHDLDAHIAALVREIDAFDAFLAACHAFGGDTRPAD